MSNVTPIRRITDAEALALLIRSAGYVDADEVMEFEDWKWEWFATTADVSPPNSATRCACISLFGSPSLTGTRVLATPPVAGPAFLSKPVGRSPHGIGTVPGPTGSISQRKGR